MSFYQDPLVDENSKRSEESVNAVRSLFTRKKGFISREEYPDYGVDFDIELVTSSEGASSKKFAVQIKSTSSVKTAKYGENIFLTLQFKTSRLGYLARREPAYGIIILYDEAFQICYYDYVEEIIKRLDNINTRDGWREQESITILLPNKILNDNEIQHIHKKFKVRHDNSHLLLLEYGSKFNIPVLDTPDQQTILKLNINNSIEVVNFLEKFGGVLYNEHEFDRIIQLLLKVNKEHVLKSPELIFLSAITYTQQGNIIEAEYYIRKALKICESLSQEQINIIDFSQIRIEFLKGDIDRITFLEKLKKISVSSTRVENQLIIDINIVFFELTSNVIEDKFKPELLDRISSLMQRIENADLTDEKKHQLKVFHSENQHNFAIRTFINAYNNFKFKESLNLVVPQFERIQCGIQTNLLTNAAEEAVRKAYYFSVENKRPLLRASAAHQLAKNFLSLRSTLSMVASEDKMAIDLDKMTEMYFDYHNLALIGYNGFLDLQMFQNSHEALITAYEIQQLCLLASGNLVGSLSPEDILNIVREIELTYDFRPFESSIPNLALFHVEEKQEPTTILLNLNDEMIENMAKKLLKAYGLPKNRLINIINSLKIMKIFHQKCTNPNIELLEDVRHTHNFSTKYTITPPFMLRDKKSNRQTRPSTDIEVLLKEFSDIITL